MRFLTRLSGKETFSELLPFADAMRVALVGIISPPACRFGSPGGAAMRRMLFQGKGRYAALALAAIAAVLGPPLSAGTGVAAAAGSGYMVLRPMSCTSPTARTACCRL